MKQSYIKSLFDLTGRVAVITGGAGLLGEQHARALAEFGAIPVLLDLNLKKGEELAKRISREYMVKCSAIRADITKREEIDAAWRKIKKLYGRVDILVNNAANNPKVEGGTSGRNWSQFENFPESVWEDDLAVGLRGAFLCSQVFGAEMAKQKKGVILNISSDLGIIAPDQRLYRDENLPEEQQPKKPVTYSALKHGILGLTKYLASYWGDRGVRVNAICPGGVYNGQPEDFVKKLSALIPLKRMARVDEYRGIVLLLCSDASSYTTGAIVIVDGGRTLW